MKILILNLIIFLVLASCGTAHFVAKDNKEDRVPANFKEDCQDLRTFCFKMTPREIKHNGLRSHEALFNYFFPTNNLPNSVNLNEVAYLNKSLFNHFSRNESVAKLYFALENLNFLSATQSYDLTQESTFDADRLLKNDQLKMISFLKKTKNSFADLSNSEQSEFFDLLKNSDIQSRRAMYFKIRSLYMSTIYDSPIGEKIAGITPTLKVHPELNAFMQSHPLGIPKVKAKSKYDVIIVGSGPAGSVLAYELKKKGKSVLLLEGGSFYHPGAVEARKISEFRESGGNRFTDDESIIFRAGNVSGGGSSVNIDLAFSPELPEVKAQFKLWTKLGHTDKDQYSSEKIKKAYQYIVEKIGTRTPSLTEINPNNYVLYNGAELSGFTPKLYDLNTYDPSESSQKISDKKSALEAFIIPAMTNLKDPLHFRPDAIVKKVLFESDGQTIRGLQVKIQRPVNVPGVIDNPMGLNFPVDEDFEIAADKVILSAGAIGTPKILLNSGIKNNNIGKHVIAHPSMPIMGKFSKDINILEGTQSTVYVPRNGYILESTSAGPGYAASMMQEDPSSVQKRLSTFNQYAGFGVMVVDESTMDNKVYFDENNTLQIHYELTDKDKRKFINGLVDATNAMFNAGATEVLIPTNENFLNQASGNLVMYSLKDSELLRKNLKLIKGKSIITSAHIQGTARMGTTASNSVVNTKQEVWGTKNLFVADSSIHPYSVGANPMQTIYTLAKIFADSF